MSLLDHRALERARKDAGLLPTTLAGQLRKSVDVTTAITKRGARDQTITLADLRRVAAALAVAPSDLLIDRSRRSERQQPHVQLAALLHRDGVASIDELASQIRCAPGDILDAIDIYNHGEHGVKMMRWGDEVGLVPDPAITVPDRAAVVDMPEALQTDRLLWEVIDRVLPEPLPGELARRLVRMADEGLVLRFDDQWRPTDAVIDELNLLEWDTVELVRFARGTGGSQGPLADPA